MEENKEVVADSRLVNDLINVLEIHGYKITREEE